jgi:lysozyme family protein
MKYTPQVAAHYEQAWLTCEIDYEADKVKQQAQRVLANKGTYVGFWQVPWFFIGLCDLRECNLNPRGVIHNGELIIGTGRKTKLVPAGRGPFVTKRESIEDSLKLQGLDKETDWSVGKFWWRTEGYNGYGYYNKGVPSPYLFSHTNHYADGSWDSDPRGGKFVADHVWKADVYDKQIGAMAVMKALVELDPTIKFFPASVSAKQAVSQRDKVRKLQQALKDGGVDPGTIDGIVGPNTIRAFQTAQKITVTGELDSETRPLFEQALEAIGGENG